MLSDQWAIKDMSVDVLWGTADDEDMVVAVIDTGVCLDHPDLQGRFLDDGYDYIDNDTTPYDEMGHGCAVSGIIAANADNEIGIAGIVPNTKILPLRVLDTDGVGTYANVIAAIYEAVSSGADIINLSLGGQDHSRLLEQAVNHAIANGVIVVAGTGNTGSEGVFYPARYPGVTAVGSRDSNGDRSSFTTYGIELDTLAPSENILSTSINGDYSYFMGTSMAVPHVSGLLALTTMPNDSTDIINTFGTPPADSFGQLEVLSTPTSTPASLYDFTCDNLTVEFREPPFNDNHIELEAITTHRQTKARATNATFQITAPCTGLFIRFRYSLPILLLEKASPTS